MTVTLQAIKRLRRMTRAQKERQGGRARSGKRR